MKPVLRIFIQLKVYEGGEGNQKQLKLMPTVSELLKKAVEFSGTRLKLLECRTFVQSFLPN